MACTNYAGYDSRPRVGELWAAWEGGLRVNDRVLSAVVFLGREFQGRFTPLGTGFLAVKNTSGRLFQHIVTARHVVEDVKSASICARINTLDGRVEHTYIEDGMWMYHDDPAVDVAVCPTHVPPEHYDVRHVHLDEERLTPQLISENQFGVGDDIFAAGMFTRHIGDIQNRPIVRTGTIASMLGEKVETNRGLVEVYLVEARSIAGLSGSPVFLQVAPLRVLPGGEVSQAQGRVHYFLGVMQGHHVTQHPMDVASPDEDYSPGDMNTGIGVVMPAERVIEVVEKPELRDERERIVANLQRNSGFVPDSAKVSEPPTTAGNPQHEEEFNRLLGAAVRKRPQDD